MNYPSNPSGDHGSARRTDIQAMRALAVVFVVVFHLWPWLLPGGFVGVDMFFVISGFLITGNLVREVRTTSKVRLAAFWSRRIRRLFPAALTVLMFVVIATLLWVPNVLWAQFARQVIGSALYLQNWILASDAVGYWTSQNLASPVQHFWSLSVEEQFYIGFPILVAVLARMQRSSERSIRAAILCITVASLVWSVWFTSVSPSAAYLVTTTRVWEFGVGALLVWVPMVRRQRPATVLFVGGVCTAVAAGFVIDAAWKFPSFIAAWPVAATAAMLLGGEALVPSLRRLVELRPLRFIGDVSYALYLWHWPLIVLLPFASGHVLTGAEKLGVAAVSLLFASITTRFVEHPVRFSSQLRGETRPPAVVLSLGGVAVVVVVLTTWVALRVDTPRTVDMERVLAPVETAASSCEGAPAGLDRARCGESISGIVPDPLIAGDDGYKHEQCWSDVRERTFNLCTVGPPAGVLRMLVVGDSHSLMYNSSYERIAGARNWTIDMVSRNSCFWTDAVHPNELSAAYTKNCESWKVSLEQHLADTAPYDVLVVTNANPANSPLPEGNTDSKTVATNGLVSAWQRQLDRGVRIVAVRDIPTLRTDVVACVATYMGEANIHCSSPRKVAAGSIATDPMLAAAAMLKVPVVDLTDVFCNATTCFPVIGNVLAYQNNDHLTTTFVKMIDGILAARIATALGLE
jgi:peptidoglycan/LPS O-acetylase OafA/YrhL